MNIRVKMRGKYYPHKASRKHPPTSLLAEKKKISLQELWQAKLYMHLGK